MKRTNKLCGQHTRSDVNLAPVQLCYVTIAGNPFTTGDGDRWRCEMRFFLASFSRTSTGFRIRCRGRRWSWARRRTASGAGCRCSSSFCTCRTSAGLSWYPPRAPAAHYLFPIWWRLDADSSPERNRPHHRDFEAHIQVRALRLIRMPCLHD